MRTRHNRTEGRAATAAVKRNVKIAARRAAAARKEAVRAAETARYERRVYRRGGSTVSASRARARAAERVARQAERDYQAAATIERHFKTAPSRRTSYQQRVVSRVTRQVARGEQPGRQTLDLVRLALAARIEAIGTGSLTPGIYLHHLSDATVAHLLQVHDVELYCYIRMGNPGTGNLDFLIEYLN